MRARHVYGCSSAVALRGDGHRSALLMPARSHPLIMTPCTRLNTCRRSDPCSHREEVATDWVPASLEFEANGAAIRFRSRRGISLLHCCFAMSPLVGHVRVRSLDVATVLILSTTAMPSTTVPNTPAVAITRVAARGGIVFEVYKTVPWRSSDPGAASHSARVFVPAVAAFARIGARVDFRSVGVIRLPDQDSAMNDENRAS